MELPSHKLPAASLLQQYAIPVHCVEVDSDVTAKEALDPNFWQHLVGKFQLGHEVIVRPRNFSYRLHAEVVALDPEGHWALLRPISLTEGNSFAPRARDASGYRIENDPVQGWRILNGRDLIAKDFPDEEAAKAALANLKAGKGKKAA